MASSSPFLIPTLVSLAAAAGGWGLGHVVRNFQAQPDLNKAKAPLAPALSVKDVLSSSAFLKTQHKPETTEAISDRYAFVQMVSTTKDESILLDFLKELSRVANPAEAQTRRQILAHRLVELKFAARHIQDRLEKDTPFAVMLMRAWAQQDPEAFRIWAASFSTSNNALAVMGSEVLLKALHETATLEEMDALSTVYRARTQDQMEGYRKAAERAAQVNTEATLKHATALPEPAKWHAMAGLAEGWAKKDVTAALAWAKTLTDPRERINCLSAICRVQLTTDMAGATKTMELIPPARDVIGMPVHGVFAAKLAETDPLAAAAVIRKLDSNFPKEEMLVDSVLPHIKDLSVSSIAGLFEGIPVSGRSHNLQDTVTIPSGLLTTLLHWNPANPQALLTETNQLPSSEVRSCLQNYLAWRMAQESPATALEAASTAEGHAKDRLIQHALQASLGTGDPTLVARGLSLADPSLRNELVDRMATTYASKFPNKAPELITALPETERHIAAARVAEVLAPSDPQAAFDLAKHIPADKQLPHVYSVGYAWAKDDPVNAGRWADSLPAGSPEQQQAVQALSTALTRSAPVDAFAWSQKITDRGSRVSHFKDLYYEWIDLDSYAALKAFQGAGLTPEEMKDVMTPPEGWSTKRASAASQIPPPGPTAEPSQSAPK